MATKLHNQMSGADLHPNAIDGTTGTELTTPSLTILDGRWVPKTGGTITPTTNSTTTLKVTKQDGTTSVLNIDTTNARVGVGTNTPSNKLSVNGVISLADATNAIIRAENGPVDIMTYDSVGNLILRCYPNNKYLQLSSDTGDVKINHYSTSTFRSVSVSPVADTLVLNAGSVGIGTGTPNSKLQVTGPIATAITTTVKTTAYTATTSDSTILADASGGTFQITLPTAVGCAGRQYTIKRTGATNNVTVGGTSAQTLDGAITKTLGSQNATLTVQSDNANWQMLSTLGTVS